MEKLLSTPSLHPLIPFVRLWYSRTSCFLWTDDSGETHDILQGEGGEQGDPLMPALFALGQHDAISAAAEQVSSVNGDQVHVVAFLDNLYLVCPRMQARYAFDCFTNEMQQRRGISTHLGKLRLWSKAREPVPAGFVDLEDQIGVGDAACDTRGLKILGTPLGHAEFIRAVTRDRLQEEEHFLCKFGGLGDLQSAWLLLTYCAVPRANHFSSGPTPDACCRVRP